MHLTPRSELSNEVPVEIFHRCCHRITPNVRSLLFWRRNNRQQPIGYSSANPARPISLFRKVRHWTEKQCCLDTRSKNLDIFLSQYWSKNCNDSSPFLPNRFALPTPWPELGLALLQKKADFYEPAIRICWQRKPISVSL